MTTNVSAELTTMNLLRKQLDSRTTTTASHHHQQDRTFRFHHHTGFTASFIHHPHHHPHQQSPSSSPPPAYASSSSSSSPPSSSSSSSSNLSSSSINGGGGGTTTSTSGHRNPFIERSQCVVCGDRARGCNFGAITCASCKEFFRRNAFKLNKLKCYFQSKCEINIYSRRFCAACRLNKCYNVGMKNEYIMTDAEKCERNMKIIERKLLGKNLSPDQTGSFGGGGDQHPHHHLNNNLEGHNNQNHRIAAVHSSSPTPFLLNNEYNEFGLDDAKTSSSSFHNNNSNNSNSNSVNYPFNFTPSPGFDHRQHSMDSSESSLSPSSLVHQSSIIDTNFKPTPPSPEMINNNGGAHREAIGQPQQEQRQQQFYVRNGTRSTSTILSKTINQMSDLIMEKPAMNTGYHQQNKIFNLEDEETVIKLLKKVVIIRDSDYSMNKFHLLLLAKDMARRLSEHGSCKLKYLTSIVQILSAETVSDLPTDRKFIDLISMAEIVTFNFIRMCKKLYTFQLLSQEDQVALVKGGVMDVLMIWSMMTINLEKECWEALDLERNFRFTLRMGLLKEANPKLYEKHRSYVMSFESEWRYDDNLMSLLIVIALFNPERPGLTKIDMIRNERNAYCNLLKLYLSTLYEESTVNKLYQRLMNQLKLTEQISEYHVKAYFDLSANEATRKGFGGLKMEILNEFENY